MNREKLEVRCLSFLHKELSYLNETRRELDESLIVLHEDESYYLYGKMADMVEQYGTEQRIDEKIVGKNCGNCKSLENKQSYTHCQRCKQNWDYNNNWEAK